MAIASPASRTTFSPRISSPRGAASYPSPSARTSTPVGSSALARECRMRDRFHYLHVHVPKQKNVPDNVRPGGRRDPFGVEQAKALLETAYALADDQMRGARWALGDDFTMADCAAAPALFYANKVVPFDKHSHLASYFDRLLARPSFARVVDEAKPYMSLFPG